MYTHVHTCIHAYIVHMYEYVLIEYIPYSGKPWWWKTLANEQNNELVKKTSANKWNSVSTGKTLVICVFVPCKRINSINLPLPWPLAVNWHALNRNVVTWVCCIYFLLIKWFVDTTNILWFGIIQLLVKNLPVIMKQEIAMIPMPLMSKYWVAIL